MVKSRSGDGCVQTVVPPQGLLAQGEDFIARARPPDPVFAHGDLVFCHGFVGGGRFGGITDWGDALVAGRSMCDSDCWVSIRGLFADRRSTT